MKVTRELLVKYHLGECTESEKSAVELWLLTDDAEQSYPAGFSLDIYQQAGWKKISERYELGQHRSTDHPFFKKLLLKSVWLQVAACFALVSTLALLYTLLSRAGQHTNNITYRTIFVPKGEKKQVRLSDGTEVWLNSDSRLIVPTAFTGDTRTISFTGEAYFCVAKNKTKPFIIRSQRTVTKVVGTKFNLRDYPTDSKSELLVEEGKVLFSGLDTANHLVLTANQQGTLGTNGTRLELLKKDMAYHSQYTDWKENTLVFDDLTLLEIKPILERWYDVKITIASKALANQRYKGSFDNPTITVVLKRICFALRTDYIQHHKTFSIGK